MSTKLDIRQSISRDVLDQLALVANKEVDDLLRSINEELTAPLQLRASSPADRVTNIDSMFVTNPETLRNRTIPPISNTLPNFTGGTVTLPAASGGNITNSTSGPAVVLTLPVGQFAKVGIHLDAVGNLQIIVGTPGASIAAAAAPAIPSNTYPIGYVIAENVGGTIQNVTNARVYQYVGGGGGGSGSGDANSFLETLKNLLNDSTYEALTANIFSQDEETKVDGSSTGDFSLVSQTFVMDAGQTLVTTQNLDAEFLASGEDVGKAQLAVQWLLSAIDTAATYELSRDGGLNWNTVAMTRVDTSDTYVGELLFPEESDPFSDSVVTTSSNTDLTNAAGLREALALQYTLTLDTDVSSIGLYLSRLGTIAGNWRLALYSDSAGLPSSMLYAQAWQTASTVSTSATLQTWLIAQPLEAGTYHFVVETDAAYKASYSVGVNALRLHGPAGSNVEFLNDGVWNEAGPISVAYAIAGTREEFTSVLSNPIANNDSQKTINQTTQQKIGQGFTLTGAGVLKRVSVQLNKLGSPTGNYYVALVANNAGVPSTLPADVLVESSAQSIASLSVGNNTVLVDIPETVLAGSTLYHIVIRAAYTSFSAGVNELRVREDQSTPGSPLSTAYNGTVWATSSPNGKIGYELYGRLLDLRVRVTSSAADRELMGLGLLYDEASGVLATGNIALERWDGTGADNENEFTLTQFIPNPDLLEVYYVQAGQVFRSGAFQIDGQKIIFPVNSFNGGGNPAAVITLWFDQTRGGAFDNSDRNAGLLAGNHLGSTDTSYDRSVAGRGIFLRRPDGTLREIALDDNDNLVVYSV